MGFILNLLVFAILIKNSSSFKTGVVKVFFDKDEVFFDYLVASTFGNATRAGYTVAGATAAAIAARESVNAQIREENRVVYEKAKNIYTFTRRENSTLLENREHMEWSYSMAKRTSHTPWNNHTEEGSALIRKGINRVFESFN
jgi:hypothetical protein